MLTIQTKYKAIALMSPIFLLLGCTTQPTTPKYDASGVCTKLPKEKVYIDSGGSLKESYLVYTPDVDLKPVVVILMKKVDLLEDKVTKLSSTSKQPKVSYHGCGPAEPIKKKFKKFRDGLYMSYTKVPIWACATQRGERIGWIYKKKKVRLSHCGIYGWCKVEGKKGYVEAWRLKRIGD